MLTPDYCDLVPANGAFAVFQIAKKRGRIRIAHKNLPLFLPLTFQVDTVKMWYSDRELFAIFRKKELHYGNYSAGHFGDFPSQLGRRLTGSAREQVKVIPCSSYFLSKTISVFILEILFQVHV